jgi:O-antigen/teichoic acid export membrane protein
LSTIHRVVKNTAVLAVAQVIGYVFSFIYILYLARYLGPGQYGIVSFALAFTGFFQIFADLGLQTLLVREIARDKSQIVKYVVNIGLVKLILAVFTFIAMAAVINIIGYSADSIRVVYIIGLAAVLNALGQLFVAIFQATEYMEVQGLGQICHTLIIFFGVLVGINLGFDVIGFSYIYLVAGIMIFVFYGLVVAVKYFGSGSSPSKAGIDTKFCRQIIWETLPFGLATIFYTAYSTADAILLSAIKGDEVVGLYSASYRIMQIFLFIPVIWGVSMFPVMAKYHITSKDSLKFTLEKSFKYLTMIAIPVGVGITLLSGKIIMLLYGPQYSQSVASLQILIWAAVFFFMDYPFAVLTLAVNRQKFHSVVLATCAVVNVTLNLIFIPMYGGVAAAAVFLVTQALGFILHYTFSVKTGYGLGVKRNLLMLSRIVVAGVVMGIFAGYFENMSLLLLIFSSAILYFLIILISGGLNRDDFNLIKSVLKKRS